MDTGRTKIVRESIGRVPCVMQRPRENTVMPANSAWRDHSDFCRCRLASGPIRPRDFEFGIRRLVCGNSTGTISVPSCCPRRFSVPASARKSLKFRIMVLCHGNVLHSQLPRTWVGSGKFSTLSAIRSRTIRTAGQPWDRLSLRAAPVCSTPKRPPQSK